MKDAIILCSGGLDSVVAAHFVEKRLEYGKIRVLFFDYGQKALEQERVCSRRCSSNLSSEFVEVKLDELGKLSTSLINRDGFVEEVKDLKDTSGENEKWYVPCRNLIFLSYALGLAEARFVEKGIVSDIFVGFKNEGKEPFPDATQEFVEKMNSVGKEVCASRFEILAPLIDKDKEDIILLGKELGVDFRKTFSCYVGKEKHCGKCLACKLRKAGFEWSGVEDVSEYD
ncbi:MAG: 7-cyano-7-deazaguanine synthase [archaeon]